MHRPVTSQMDCCAVFKYYTKFISLLFSEIYLHKGKPNVITLLLFFLELVFCLLKPIGGYWSVFFFALLTQFALCWCLGIFQWHCVLCLCSGNILLEKLHQLSLITKLLRLVGGKVKFCRVQWYQKYSCTAVCCQK